MGLPSLAYHYTNNKENNLISSLSISSHCTNKTTYKKRKVIGRIRVPLQDITHLFNSSPSGSTPIASPPISLFGTQVISFSKQPEGLLKRRIVNDVCCGTCRISSLRKNFR